MSVRTICFMLLMIDLDILEFIPDIKNSPQAMEVIAELVAKLPEMEIDGNMGEEFE